MKMNITVSPSWLFGQLEQPSSRLRIVDCRFSLQDTAAGARAYAEGHIPGAVYMDLERDLSAPIREDRRGGRHPLPDPAALAQTLGRAGIGRGTPVVAYDDQGGAMAARLVWLLRWLGHEGGASIMDGGFSGWQAQSYPVSAETPDCVTAVYEPSVQPQLAVDAAYVRERLGRAGVTLVDSRETPRYLGQTEPIDPVAGHIPGAVNFFWRDGVDVDSNWLSAEEQRQRFAALSPEDEIIVYCGSGVTACPNVFALEAAGFRNVKLYAGSWSDWISYEGNPVATGEE